MYTSSALTLVRTRPLEGSRQRQPERDRRVDDDGDVRGATGGMDRGEWTRRETVAANANSDRGPVNTVPHRNPNIETVAPTSMNECPEGPTTTALPPRASDVIVGRRGAQEPADHLNRDVKTTTPAIARNTALGTVRDGACTSPLGAARPQCRETRR